MVEDGSRSAGRYMRSAVTLNSTMYSNEQRMAMELPLLSNLKPTEPFLFLFLFIKLALLTREELNYQTIT